MKKLARMSLLNIFFCSFLLSSCAQINKNSYKRDLFPRSDVASADITTLDAQILSQKGERLAAVSLQGLVNRKKPQIYLLLPNNIWLYNYYKEKGYVKTEDKLKNVYELIEKYKNYMSGAVVFDPEKEYTVNTATNVAGVENRIIISPDMVDKVKEMGINNIKDLRNYNFSDASGAYQWEYENYFNLQRDDSLACFYYSKQFDFIRDYAIQFKIHVFWLPGQTDPEYEPLLDEKAKNMLKTTKANIPILGFWGAVTDTGEGRGVKEYNGVKLAGESGKYTVCSTHVGNYSYNSGINVDESVYEQKNVRDKEFAEYDPRKKYVAFIMIDSGDAPGYFQNNIYNQWKDENRGTVPISISVTPTLMYLAPGILQMMYETATENEYFFNSISGIGYTYPLIGYGSKGVINNNGDVMVSEDDILTEFYKMTEYQMKKLDLDMLGLYSYPLRRTWDYAKDDEIINKYIEPRKGIKTIISDMGRISGNTIENPNRILNNYLTIHHTLTQWPLDWDVSIGNTVNRSLDKEAVNYLVNEIIKYSENTDFIQAMFLSWAYGPRRLAMVQEELQKYNYEFVTLNEFEYLYRKANNVPERS